MQTLTNDTIDITRNETPMEQSELQKITVEIQFLKQQTAQNIIEIGKRLKQVKESLEHGHFTDWLTTQVEFTPRTARRFIQVSEQFGKGTTSTVFTTGKLFELISLPESVDRQEFIEAQHTVPSTGETKTVDEMTVRELREVKKELAKAQRERDEAIDQAQSILERDRQLRAENERLKQDKNPEPHIVEKLVEVYPKDYERILREHQDLNTKNAQLGNQLDEIQSEYRNKLDDIHDGEVRAALRDLRKALKDQIDVITWHQPGALLTFRTYLRGNPDAAKAVREFLDTYEQKAAQTITEWRDALSVEAEATEWTITV